MLWDVRSELAVPGCSLYTVSLRNCMSGVVRMKRRFQNQLRFVVAITVASVLTVSVNFASPYVAEAYNCSPPNYDNCYGTYRWDGWNIGAETSIKVVTLVSGGGDRHITNAMWLGDAGRTCSVAAACWVEAGYTTDQDDNGINKYYFADVRPGQSYAETMIQTVPESHVNGYVKVAIWRNVGSFTVRIQSPSGGTIFHGYSEPNSMQVNLVEIGQELRGSSSQSAPTAYWRYNKWKDEFTSQWNYQSSEPNNNNNFSSDNPPYAAWSVKPSSSSTGGSWRASCC